jgi:hypothetical protein
MEEQPQRSRYSVLKYYVLGAITAGAIALGIGVAYSREIKHAASVAIHKYLVLDEKTRDSFPDFITKAWDSMAEQRHGMGPEELKQKRQEVRDNLEIQIQQYEK